MDRNKLLIFYKLLGDIFFLLLLFFGLSLVTDSLIPGIITSHVSFLRILFLIALNLVGLYAVGSLAGIHLESDEVNKKTTALVAVVGTLLVFLSLFKLNAYLALFILLISIACGVFLWKMFFED